MRTALVCLSTEFFPLGRRAGDTRRILLETEWAREVPFTGRLSGNEMPGAQTPICPKQVRRLNSMLCKHLPECHRELARKSGTLSHRPREEREPGEAVGPDRCCHRGCGLKGVSWLPQGVSQTAVPSIPRMNGKWLPATPMPWRGKCGPQTCCCKSWGGGASLRKPGRLSLKFTNQIHTIWMAPKPSSQRCKVDPDWQCVGAA